MAIILLNTGEQVLIDDADLPLVSKYKWFKKQSNKFKSVYAGTGHKGIRMHRLILGLTDPKLQVDHINHNTLDNRRQNLRIVNNQQNSANKKPSRLSKTGYKGVRKASKGPKFEAFLVIRPHTIYLGSFKTPEEAAKAYDQTAKEWYGSYAYLNFQGVS